MNVFSLDERAARFRGLVALLEKGSAKAQARLLPPVIEQAEELAAELLSAGGAEPELKAEIIAWVVRFRAEKDRIEASKPEPVTRAFSYDTSDPRTQNPGFVKISIAERRAAAAAAKGPTVFGKDESAVTFSRDLARLRSDIEEGNGSFPSDDEKASLVARLVELHKAHKTAVHWRYHRDLVSELDLMAIRVTGKPLRAAAKPVQRFHQPVPAELAPMFGRQVVSGGLPALGRRSR